MNVNLRLYTLLIVDYWCREKMEGQVGAVGRKGEY